MRMCLVSLTIPPALLYHVHWNTYGFWYQEFTMLNFLQKSEGENCLCSCYTHLTIISLTRDNECAWEGTSLLMSLVWHRIFYLYIDLSQTENTLQYKLYPKVCFSINHIIHLWTGVTSKIKGCILLEVHHRLTAHTRPVEGTSPLLISSLSSLFVLWSPITII